MKDQECEERGDQVGPPKTAVNPFSAQFHSESPIFQSAAKAARSTGQPQACSDRPNGESLTFWILPIARLQPITQAIRPHGQDRTCPLPTTKGALHLSAPMAPASLSAHRHVNCKGSWLSLTGPIRSMARSGRSFPCCLASHKPITCLSVTWLGASLRPLSRHVRLLQLGYCDGHPGLDGTVASWLNFLEDVMGGGVIIVVSLRGYICGPSRRLSGSLFFFPHRIYVFLLFSSLLFSLLALKSFI
ncbi:hypothetical protein BO78DRAFT_127302 [Aspergillus sclerotiicarbonarius CBS 121057]|uniref:Uncharacterized protein n=1 Tax=Aspergillus sclerotiicarbonarius (strain CBS 121057 / IBT 28362) TaxID=1448318 RepID=A0A319EDN8_ASPSB|nr:hypothetical protein BO78DRAFT_127302 [Aspergillus sclerotiicarbonarius CBS 121057]